MVEDEEKESHYHICTGPIDAPPVADVRFEEYEESLTCFVGLANMMFQEFKGSDYDLSIEQALEATNHGKSRGAYVGPPSLTLFWFRCEEDIHESSAWN